MKKILIIPNTKKDKGLAVTARVAELLSARGAEVYIEKKYLFDVSLSAFLTEKIPEGIELLLVVGGDGSMLDASAAAIERGIPMLGVNLGKLGYLSEVDVGELEVLNRLFDGEYKIEEKMLLEVTHKCGGCETKSERLAVNDVIISHDTFLGIADFKLVKSDGERVRYRADGIILSTPIGSTAYSLSAGGPIVAHDINAILATPIAPHSFFNRSIMFNSSDTLCVKNDGDTELKISVDGRLFENLNKGEECIVAASPKKLKMLSFSQNNTFSTLFKKMRILEDIQ